MSHFISRCEHGTVGAQCRCPAKDKEVRIIPCPDYCASRVTQQPMSTERYLEKLKDERDMFERRSEALAAQLREKTEEIERLRLGLRSIANNTCCVPCREAALVAKATLADSGSKPSL